MIQRQRIPRHERVTINHEFASVEQFITEYVTDISHSGIFIRSKDPLPPGTRVNLRFTIIMDDIQTIEGTGEVVRVSQDPMGMGVAFSELTPKSEALIKRLLKGRKR
ncbi:MAG: PilZ domain-containing protein [Pseudomonadota bacterium]